MSGPVTPRFGTGQSGSNIDRDTVWHINADGSLSGHPPASTCHRCPSADPRLAALEARAKDGWAWVERLQTEAWVLEARNRQLESAIGPLETALEAASTAWHSTEGHDGAWKCCDRTSCRRDRLLLQDPATPPARDE